MTYSKEGRYNVIEDISAKPVLYGHPEFYELLNEMKELHSKKNHDYAGDGNPLANFKECERFGVSAFLGCFIRMTDKYMRILNFIKSGNLSVNSESIEDTLKDLSVYSLIDIILFRELMDAKTKVELTEVGETIKRNDNLR